MTEAPKPILEVRDLSVAFQARTELVLALTGVSFKVPQRGSVGLWGHSGCGKSTAMKALLGLPIDGPGWIKGEAWLDGVQVSPDVRDYVSINATGVVRKDTVGFRRNHQRRLKPYLGVSLRSIFQEPIYSFDSERSVGLQAVSFIEYLSNCGSNGHSKTELLDEFANALSFLNLEVPYVKSRCNWQLSGGECQRVLLAMNVVGRPKLLFADEPTTAMDHETRLLANALLTRKIESGGMGLLISSHNREELLALTDFVVVLCKGVVVERLSRRYLSEAPDEGLHPYTRKLWYSLGDRDSLQPRGNPVAKGEPQGCPFVEECAFPLTDKRLERLCWQERPPFFAVAKEHEVSCWLHRSHTESESQAGGAGT